MIQSSLLHNIFKGQQGIRAGWRIGIFLILMALITLLFILPAKFILEMAGLPPTDEQPIQVFVGELAVFLGLLATSMIAAYKEHNPLISYGLEGTHRFVKLLAGILTGFVALSALVYIMKLCGYLSFDGQTIFGWDAIKYGIAWGVGCFLVGLYEEYFFRGYIQATLTRGIGFWWSALLLSCIFGSIHILNKGESPVGIFSAVLMGLVFCISLWYLKQLWWAIGFHSSWNWSQSYLWGTPNSGKVVQGHLYSVHPVGNVVFSGGSTGPEGSILVFPVLLIIAFLMWIVWRRR